MNDKYILSKPGTRAQFWFSPIQTYRYLFRAVLWYFRKNMVKSYNLFVQAPASSQAGGGAGGGGGGGGGGAFGGGHNWGRGNRLQ